jgi:hypothetical protein
VSRRLTVSEHHHEPEPGLPERLPAGERLLWRGAPDWRVLARRGFQLNKFALYFGLMVLWRGVTTLVDGGNGVNGGGVGAALATLLWTLPLAGLALGFIVLLARWVAHTTVYTLTDRRVVMRVGVVLTVTFNLPLRRIEAARLHQHGGGADAAGDIALVLDAEDRIGYLHLWPHVRPWRFTRTEPMLRAVPQARAVAGLLADALAQAVTRPVSVPVPVPVPVAVPVPSQAGLPLHAAELRPQREAPAAGPQAWARAA